MTVPAGWHADPWNQAPLRWWDGAQWTAATAAPPGDDMQRAPARGAALEHLVPADGRTAIINGTNPGLHRGRPARLLP